MRFQRFDDRYVVRLEGGEAVIESLTTLQHDASTGLDLLDLPEKVQS